MAGILRPTAGSIRIEGQEIVGMSESQLSALRLARFGFVFQDGQLLPELSNQENVALPLMLAGVSKGQAIQRAQEQLSALGLAGHGPYRPGQLSGGQAQRVAIARALITNPQVVFSDCCHPRPRRRKLASTHHMRDGVITSVGNEEATR